MWRFDICNISIAGGSLSLKTLTLFLVTNWLLANTRKLSSARLDLFYLSNQKLVGGFNPFEKYESKWESSPSRDENKKCLKPPPRKRAISGLLHVLLGIL